MLWLYASLRGRALHCVNKLHAKELLLSGGAEDAGAQCWGRMDRRGCFGPYLAGMPSDQLPLDSSGLAHFHATASLKVLAEWPNEQEQLAELLTCISTNVTRPIFKGQLQVSMISTAHLCVNMSVNMWGHLCMPIWGSMYMFSNLRTCVNRFEQSRIFVFMGHLGFLKKKITKITIWYFFQLLGDACHAGVLGLHSSADCRVYQLSLVWEMLQYPSQLQTFWLALFYFQYDTLKLFWKQVF